MKKRIHYLIFSCALAGALPSIAFAQNAGGATSGTSGTGTTATGTGGTGTGTSGAKEALGSVASGAAAQLENVVIRHGGKLYHMQKGTPQPITSETTLPNGAKVDPTGTVTMQDGRTMSVKDGQMLTPNGSVSNAPQNILNRLPGGGGTGTSGAGTGTSGATGTGTSGTGTGTSGATGTGTSGTGGSGGGGR